MRVVPHDIFPRESESEVSEQGLSPAASDLDCKVLQKESSGGTPTRSSKASPFGCLPDRHLQILQSGVYQEERSIPSKRDSLLSKQEVQKEEARASLCATSGEQPGEASSCGSEAERRPQNESSESCLGTPRLLGEEGAFIGIESIEYAGLEEVWDLETEKNHNYFAGGMLVHNCQHLDYEFIPVINSAMNASRKGSVSIFSGTPLTLDNGIQALWEKSSKAEWVVKCEGCGKWNMASAQAELLKMIGLKGVVCAFCDGPLNPRLGRWYHTEKENVNFHGYHVPQIIMPMHYADAKKWRDLLSYREGHLGYTKQKFFNEILGESADFGLKLVTLTDIRNASVLGPNDLKQCIDKFRRCKVRVLSVDWGGHGQEEISFTAVALVGLNPQTGKVECHYCKRFHVGASYDEEVRELLYLFREGACHWLAHDRCGAGAVREAMMIQAGMPVQRIIGLNYVRASTRDMVTYVPPYAGELRGYHSLDKARSLVLQAICIKSGIVLLPEYESSKDVTHDLLALMEDKHDSLGAGDIYLIRRQPKMPDDFANALNYGCIAIWHSEQQYPDLSAVRAIKLTQSQLDIAAPQNPTWR